MATVYIAVGVLILFLLAHVMVEGPHRSLSEQARRILGILLCVAWMVFLAVRYLAAAILAGHPGGSYPASLEQLGPWPLILAWGSLAAGVFLLSSRKEPLPAPVQKSEATQASVEG